MWLDLYGLSSVADFAVRLDRALSGTTGRLREVLDRVAGGLSINLGLVSVELRRVGQVGARPDRHRARPARVDRPHRRSSSAWCW